MKFYPCSSNWTDDGEVCSEPAAYAITTTSLEGGSATLEYCVEHTTLEMASLTRVAIQGVSAALKPGLSSVALTTLNGTREMP